MIELKGVSKKYGITKAVEDVSFTLPQGQIVGLFGENGAGKSTLMNIIGGVLQRDDGVLVDVFVVEMAVDAKHRALQIQHTRGLIVTVGLVLGQGEVEGGVFGESGDIFLESVECHAETADELKRAVCRGLFHEFRLVAIDGIELIVDGDVLVDWLFHFFVIFLFCYSVKSA